MSCKMTMHSAILKEQEEIIPSLNSRILGSVHWWCGLGSPSTDEQLGLNKGNLPQFTIFPVSRSGNLKALDKGEKSSKPFETFSKQSASQEYQGRLEPGYCQSSIAKYAYADPCYGLFSPFGSQLTGRIMLPLDLTSDDGPIYVNAKQYHRIIRRRISRAKAQAANKKLKTRKPYLHRSRHLHAVRRPRGCGGRFLNTKTSSKGKTGNETEKNIGSANFSFSTDSQNSEVLQSNSGNLSSPNEENIKKLNILGTEVTSIFSTANLNLFSSNNNNPRSFTHPLSEMMNTGHGLAMSSNWF